MEIKEIRRRNLLDLLRDQHMTHAAFAQKTGGAEAHISQVVTRARNMGDKVARRIEVSFGLTHGWMDTTTHAIHSTREPDAYDLVESAQMKEAIDRFRALDPAFRTYILMKMDELQRIMQSLPPFARRNFKAPDSDTYYQWEKDVNAHMENLKRRNGEKADNKA